MKLLKPITLEFKNSPENLEKEFIDYYFEKKTMQQRIGLALALFLYLIFIFLDIIMAQRKSYVFISLRVFGMLPYGVFAIYSSYQEYYKKYHQVIIFFLNFIGALLIFIMIIIADPPVNYMYYAGEILIIIFAFTFSGQWFKYSLIFAICTIILFEISAFVSQIPIVYVISNNFFFLSSTFLAMIAGHTIESTYRIDFYNTRLLKIEKEKVENLNNRLEETVEQRTSELAISNNNLEEELSKSRELVTELESLQDQLVQSQKMEAIGHLAGGVAHDFNNLLTVINGYSESILYTITKDDELHVPISEILEAGKRAANLISQLLAFSRKQLLQPEIVNINNSIKNFEKMIKQLLVEHINLNFDYSYDDPTIKVDPGQFEQIILNLVINARDAMYNGGDLTIRTSKINITKADQIKYHIESTGEFALISIIDTGIGMDQSTIKHIFEPFFTTKEVGKGTGLGLSTVFGIISQSGGNIYVDSEPDSGTKFDIVFPIVNHFTKSERDKVVDNRIFYGVETVLLIEDNPEVRKFIEAILSYFQYTVLAAKDYDEATSLFHKNKDKINIVVSDIMLPGKSGKDIIDEFLNTNSDLKYIFISGYSDTILGAQLNLDKNINFIQKPFTRETLMLKLRSVLDN